MTFIYRQPQKPLRFLYAVRGRSTYRLYIRRAYRPAVHFPETLMLDVAYLAGLLIAYGLFYGFSYVCSRL
jgi:hypothetical protein